MGDRKGYGLMAHYANTRHTVRRIKIGGVAANLHMCMNHKKQMIPCDHLHIGMKYDENLISAIMDQLPRFVHKHVVVYKMFTTLKLYYLHQQELLNQVLALLKEHIHSKELAATLMSYIGTMQSSKMFGWLSNIKSILTTHMDASLNMSSMYKLIAHQRLVHQLHQVIYSAAGKNNKQIMKMYRVLNAHGFTGRFFKTHKFMFRGRNKIMRKIRHVFHKYTKTVKHHTTRTVTRHVTRTHHSSSSRKVTVVHHKKTHAKAKK